MIPLRCLTPVPLITLVLLALVMAPQRGEAQQPANTPAALGFEFFRTRIQPVFLNFLSCSSCSSWLTRHI